MSITTGKFPKALTGGKPKKPRVPKTKVKKPTGVKIPKGSRGSTESTLDKLLKGNL